MDYNGEHVHGLTADNKDYWTSLPGIMRRAQNLGQVFTYDVFNGAAKVLGSTEGASWMQWVIVPDDRVCDICLGNAAKGSSEHPGWFRPGWFTPDMPAHPNCRCQWQIWFPAAEEGPP